MINKIKRWFDKLILFFKNHRLACALAIFVGIASVAPHILAQQSLGSNYQGFPPLLFQDNEDHYLARIQEILDGHWLVASPQLYEYKDNLPLVFPIGEYLYALPSLLFGVPVLFTFVAFKLIFPALLFLLVYFLIYNLSRRTVSDRITASLGGLLVTLGFNFVNYKQVWSLLAGQSIDPLTSVWTRPVNPITGALFLFIFLILFWKSFNSEKRRYSAMSGIVIGFMSGYIYSWLMALAIVGATIIISLARCRFRVIKKMFFVIFCSILAGLPAWYLWLHSFFASEDNSFAAFHSGYLLTHQPILNKIVLLQTIFFLPLFLYEWKRRKKIGEKLEEWWWFAATLVAGNWLVFNQQIITGREMWPAHLTQYTILMAFVTFILVLGNYFKARTPKLWFSLVVMISGVIALYTGLAAFSYRASDQMKEFAAVQRFVPVFSWLNQQAPKDCVVLVEENKIYAEPLGDWMPAFTHCNSYLNNNALVPTERAYFSYLVDLRLGGIKEQDLEQYLWDHKIDLRFKFFTLWTQWVESDDRWLAEPIYKLVNQYHDFLKEDFTAALRRHKIDYLVSEGPLSVSLAKQFFQARLLEKVGLFYIYQL